jgi:hypothetical protein
MLTRERPLDALSGYPPASLAEVVPFELGFAIHEPNSKIAIGA